MQKGRRATRRGYLPAAAIIILAAITLAVAFVIYFNRDLILKTKKDQSAQQAIVPPSPKLSPTPDASRGPNGSAETANWKTYTSKSHKFSVEFPENWRLKENSDFESNDLTPFNDTAELILQSPENLDPAKDSTHGAGYGISFYTIRIDKGSKKLMEIINEQFANYGPGSKCVIQQAKVGEINGYKISNCFFGYTEAFYL